MDEIRGPRAMKASSGWQACTDNRQENQYHIKIENLLIREPIAVMEPSRLAQYVGSFAGGSKLPTTRMHPRQPSTSLLRLASQEKHFRKVPSCWRLNRL